MNQRCYTCGRCSPIGGALLHFDGCQVGATADYESLAAQPASDMLASDEGDDS